MSGGKGRGRMATDAVTDSARDEILRRIRTANGKRANEVAAEAGWKILERSYCRVGSLGREALIELFEDRLRDYDARVFRVAPGEVATAVGDLLAERKLQRIVVPVGLNEEWLPERFEFVVDEGLTAAELDAVDGVMTGATVAIAATGTLVLQNLAGQGRRVATLVPDYHLCVVRAEDLVETVPEAMTRLQETAGLATTFISGPSATADIEMTRIKGVHGPRFLDVLLLG